MRRERVTVEFIENKKGGRRERERSEDDTYLDIHTVVPPGRRYIAPKYKTTLRRPLSNDLIQVSSTSGRPLFAAKPSSVYHLVLQQDDYADGPPLIRPFANATGSIGN